MLIEYSFSEVSPPERAAFKPAGTLNKALTPSGWTTEET
jgi:hypothetical protein